MIQIERTIAWVFCWGLQLAGVGLLVHALWQMVLPVIILFKKRIFRLISPKPITLARLRIGPPGKHRWIMRGLKRDSRGEVILH